MADPKHVSGVVTVRHEVTPDLWITRIRPAAPIHFLPGQYVTIGLPGEGRVVERPYSVASSPHESELEFFVERVSGGKLTPALYEVPEGGEVMLRPAAKGRFLFDRESGNRNHFMAATVTGVAPFVSMLRTLSADADAGGTIRDRIVLLHGASTPVEFGYYRELTQSADEHEWFRYVPTISRPRLAPDWAGERGRVEDVARKYLDRAGFAAGDTTAYACGNPAMIRNIDGVLTRAGFERAFIREEMYWPGC